MKNKDNYIPLFIMLLIFYFTAIIFIYNYKIEHEKTIQKAVECGYEPISIGGDYWNKGD